MSLERPDVIGRVAVYTTLCAGSAGLTFVLLDALRKGYIFNIIYQTYPLI